MTPEERVTAAQEVLDNAKERYDVLRGAAQVEMIRFANLIQLSQARIVDAQRELRDAKADAGDWDSE